MGNRLTSSPSLQPEPEEWTSEHIITRLQIEKKQRKGLLYLLYSANAIASKGSKLEFFLPDLPDEVLDRIRACLPLTAYIRSSLVCKNWKNATFSNNLLRLCSDMHPPEPWLFAICTDQTSYYLKATSYAFDSQFCTWRKVRFPVISQLDRHPVHAVAASDGLVCLMEYSDQSILYVVNPLMGTCLELPRWNEKRIEPVIGLAVDRNSCSFKVIAVGGFQSEAITEVYDSTTCDWTTTSKLPAGRKLAFACSFYSNGRFYCWTFCSQNALLVYDVNHGVWDEVPISLPAAYSHGRLVEHRNRILLVGISNGCDTFKSIRIWQLKESGEKMEEIARMPYGILKEICGRGRVPLVQHILTSGDFLYLYDQSSQKLIVCDLSKKPPQWQQLTPVVPLCVDNNQVYLFSFCVHLRFLKNVWE